MIPGSANPLLLASAAAAPTGYAISRSLRFNSADSAYLSRTPASAGNRKTWTWAGWVKRSSISSSGVLLGASANNECEFQLWFDSTGEIEYDVTPLNESRIILGSTALFRDPSAWLHVTLSVDTNATIDSQRIRIYINKLEVALNVYQLGSGYVPQGSDLSVNAASTAHYIGGRVINSDRYFSGYLADIHFIDGQALDPTSFGEFDDNGIWQPKAYTGTYGTNGFHLAFSDNSTAGSLGDDSSGNGNNWTVNNISVAAGAGNDSLVDVPTNGTETDTGLGGEVRGNYCTANPLMLASPITLANGNLQVSGTNLSGGWRSQAATFALSAGQYYWEATVTSASTAYGLGLAAVENDLIGYHYPGYTATSYGYHQDGTKYNNDSSSAYGAALGASVVVGVAFNADSGQLTFYRSGVSQGVAFTVTSGKSYYPIFGIAGTGTAQWDINFGQRPFAYTAPSGFKALCTANLPSTTITTSGIYTGNGVADGPFVYLNGVPTAMTIEGNGVTFGTDADKLSNGFKIRTTSGAFNVNASTYNYSITSTGDPFKTARAQAN